MIRVLSSAEPAGLEHRRCTGQRSQRKENCHVQVTEHVPDRPGHPGPRRRGHRAGLAAGVIALDWPGPTALVLVLIVGVWAVIAGLVEIAAAFGAGEPAGTRAMFILAGLATAAFGVVLCARPGIGAVTLALLFGLFNLIAGIWMLAQGIELRRTGKTLHPVRPAQPETKAA